VSPTEALCRMHVVGNLLVAADDRDCRSLFLTTQAVVQRLAPGPHAVCEAVFRA
jgi:hypothetical protein